MRITEGQLRQIIREELDEAEKGGLWANIRKRRASGKRRLRPGDKNYPKTLRIKEIESVLEGILDATSGATRPDPIPPDVRAKNRQRNLDNAKKTSDLAAKKLSPSVIPKKAEIDKMAVGDVKKLVNDFGKDNKSPDKEDSKKVAAAVLDLSTRDPQGSKDMLSTLKSNTTLRGAVTSTPGMTDMQSAVDANLKANGKDPQTAVADSWRELGRLTNKYNLSEHKMKINENTVKRLIREEAKKILSEAVAPFSVVDRKLVINGIKTRINIKTMGKVFNDIKVDAASMNPDGSVNISLDAGSMKADKKIEDPRKVKQIIDTISSGKPYVESSFIGTYEIAPIA